MRLKPRGQLGEPDATSIADLTINTAWSLWHVIDWIGNNPDPTVSQLVAAKGVTAGGTDAFQRQLRSESPELEICWALALRFKHFELEADSKARPILDGDSLGTSTGVTATPAYRLRLCGRDWRA